MRGKEDGAYELKEVASGNTEVIIDAQQIEPYDSNEGAQPGTRASPLTKKYGNNWNKKDVKASLRILVPLLRRSLRVSWRLPRSPLLASTSS